MVKDTQLILQHSHAKYFLTKLVEHHIYGNRGVGAFLSMKQVRKENIIVALDRAEIWWSKHCNSHRVKCLSLKKFSVEMSLKCRIVLPVESINCFANPSGMERYERPAFCSFGPVLLSQAPVFEK